MPNEDSDNLNYLYDTPTHDCIVCGSCKVYGEGVTCLTCEDRRCPGCGVVREEWELHRTRYSEDDPLPCGKCRLTTRCCWCNEEEDEPQTLGDA